MRLRSIERPQTTIVRYGTVLPRFPWLPYKLNKPDASADGGDLPDPQLDIRRLQSVGISADEES